MLRLKYLTNKCQKRLIRPLYANTQATPYAAVLDDTALAGQSGYTTWRDNTGTTRVPSSSDTSPLSGRTATAYTLKNSVIPGLVMVRTGAGAGNGDKITVASGLSTAAEYPLGLCANFIGGDLDDGFAGDSLQNQVGVWRGPDAVFELLAPAFNDAGTGPGGITTGQWANGRSLTAAIAAITDGSAIPLYAGPDGRLMNYSSAGSRVVVAHLIERVSASRIVIDLKI